MPHPIAIEQRGRRLCMLIWGLVGYCSTINYLQGPLTQALSAAQPALEGGLPLEFSAVTPQMVGPSAEPSIDFPLKVMNIYKTNL